MVNIIHYLCNIRTLHVIFLSVFNKNKFRKVVNTFFILCNWSMQCWLHASRDKYWICKSTDAVKVYKRKYSEANTLVSMLYVYLISLSFNAFLELIYCTKWSINNYRRVYNLFHLAPDYQIFQLFIELNSIIFLAKML